MSINLLKKKLNSLEFIIQNTSYTFIDILTKYCQHITVIPESVIKLKGQSVNLTEARASYRYFVDKNR